MAGKQATTTATLRHSVSAADNLATVDFGSKVTGKLIMAVCRAKTAILVVSRFRPTHLSHPKISQIGGAHYK